MKQKQMSNTLTKCYLIAEITSTTFYIADFKIRTAAMANLYSWSFCNK